MHSFQKSAEEKTQLSYPNLCEIIHQIFTWPNFPIFSPTFLFLNAQYPQRYLHFVFYTSLPFTISTWNPLTVHYRKFRRSSRAIRLFTYDLKSAACGHTYQHKVNYITWLLCCTLEMSKSFENSTELIPTSSSVISDEKPSAGCS